MQRLKETYPNDRQKMQELMALYKRGANPVAGCLPIRPNTNIFSLYKVLFVTIEMYHAPFAVGYMIFQHRTL